MYIVSSVNQVQFLLLILSITVLTLYYSILPIMQTMLVYHVYRPLSCCHYLGHVPRFQ